MNRNKMYLFRKTRRIGTGLPELTLLDRIRAFTSRMIFTGVPWVCRQARRKFKCVIAVLLALVLVAIYNAIYSRIADRNVELIMNVVQEISNPNKSVLYDKSTVILEPWRILSCHENFTTFALLMVVSAPGRSSQRDVIRSTFLEMKQSWESSLGRPQNESRQRRLFQTLFFVGVPNGEGVPVELQAEWRQYGDLVVDDMIDSFLNLTVKTLRMLKWVLHNCADEVRYVVKMDDDVFVNMPRLFNFLWAYGNPSIVAGHVYKTANVIRDPMSKWFTPRSLYPNEKFPDYLSGVTYVLGIKAAQHLLEESKAVPLFHMEDVYLTGLIAAERIRWPLKQLGINEIWMPWHQPFTRFPRWQLELTVIHPVTSRQFRCWTRCTFQFCNGFWKFWTHLVFSYC